MILCFPVLRIGILKFKEEKCQKMELLFLLI